MRAKAGSALLSEFSVNESIHFCSDHMEIFSKHNIWFFSKVQHGFTNPPLLCHKHSHFQIVLKYLCVFSCLAGNQVFHIASEIPNDQLHKSALGPRACNSQNSDVTRLWEKHYGHDKDFYHRYLVIQFHLKSSRFFHCKNNQGTSDHMIFTSVVCTQPDTNSKQDSSWQCVYSRCHVLASNADN